MFFFQRNSPPSFAFSVAHVSVDISILSKKNQLCCFFSLKVRVAKRFTAKTRLCLKCEILTRLHEGVDVRENQNFLDAYFIFLPMVLRARELRYDSCVPSIYYIFCLPHFHFVLSELIGENVKSVGQGNFTLVRVKSWKSQGISETSGCGNHEDTHAHTLPTWVCNVQGSKRVLNS